MSVNFNLSSDLRDDITVDNLLFRENLYSNNKLVLFLSSKIDMTKPLLIHFYFPFPSGLPI